MANTITVDSLAEALRFLGEEGVAISLVEDPEVVMRIAEELRMKLLLRKDTA